MKPTWKETGTSEHLGTTYPIPNGFTRIFRDLELHWSFRLALNNRDAVADPVSNNEIGNLQADKITATQFAVDCKIEQSQIPEIAREFEPGADGPDLLWQQRAFLANQPTFIPGYALRFDGGEVDSGHELSSIRPSHSWRRHHVDPVILSENQMSGFGALSRSLKLYRRKSAASPIAT
jgi:hypothetical protein